MKTTRTRRCLTGVFCAVLLVLSAGCGRRSDGHAAAPGRGAPPVSSSDTAAALPPGAPISSGMASQAAPGPETPGDSYPYDIAADRKSFQPDKIDITVGDKLYMTQINDWYTNFSDYQGKSVAIEGYYVLFNGYTFVGRKGPSCPYCTGGYVDFEFKSDEDLSALVSESSWIRVTGILREGTMYLGDGQPGQPFYYIEAMKVEKLPKVGIDTITN